MGKWAPEIVQVLRCESTLKLTEADANSCHSTWKEVVLADIRDECAILNILHLFTMFTWPLCWVL